MNFRLGKLELGRVRLLSAYALRVGLEFEVRIDGTAVLLQVVAADGTCRQVSRGEVQAWADDQASWEYITGPDEWPDSRRD